MSSKSLNNANKPSKETYDSRRWQSIFVVVVVVVVVVALFLKLDTDGVRVGVGVIFVVGVVVTIADDDAGAGGAACLLLPWYLFWCISPYHLTTRSEDKCWPIEL